MVSKLRTLIALGALAVFGATACDRSPPTTTTTSTTTTQQVAQTTTAAINADDFSLGTVTSLISNGGVGDLATLEAKINDPASGINNVDVDKDGQVDYVNIRETPGPSGETLEFLAHPSSNPSGDPVLVSSVSINNNTTTQTVQVVGAYPNYVGGYQDNSYVYNHQGMTFGDAVLLSMLLRPHAYYVAPMPRYVARPVMVGPALTTTRSTFQTTTRVAPVPKTARPSTYQAPPSAARAPATVTQPRATGSITGNAQQQRDFTQRDQAKPKATGGSFGAGTARPATTTPPPARTSSPPPAAPPRSVPRAPSGSTGGKRR